MNNTDDTCLEYKFYWPVELLTVMVREYKEVADPLQVAVCRLLLLESEGKLILPSNISAEQRIKRYTQLGEYICVSYEVIEKVVHKLQAEGWIDANEKITISGKDKLNNQRDKLYYQEGKIYYMFANLLNTTVFPWSSAQKEYGVFAQKDEACRKNGNQESCFSFSLQGINTKLTDEKLGEIKKLLPAAFQKSLKNKPVAYVPQQRAIYRDPGLPDSQEQVSGSLENINCEIISHWAGYLICSLKQENENAAALLDFPLQGVSYRDCVQCLQRGYQISGDKFYKILSPDKNKLEAKQLQQLLQQVTSFDGNRIRQHYRQGVATEFEKWIYKNGFSAVWNLQEKILSFDPFDPFNLRTIFNESRASLRSDIWVPMEQSVGFLLNAYIAKTNQLDTLQKFEYITEFSDNNKTKVKKLFTKIREEYQLTDENNLLTREIKKLEDDTYDLLSSNIYDCLKRKKNGEIAAGASNLPRLLYLMVDAYLHKGQTPFGQLLDAPIQIKTIRNLTFFQYIEDIRKQRNTKNAAHAKGTKFDLVSREEFDEIFEEYRHIVKLLLTFMPKEWRKN